MIDFKIGTYGLKKCKIDVAHAFWVERLHTLHVEENISVSRVKVKNFMGRRKFMAKMR